jgi:hypothetical protein
MMLGKNNRREQVDQNIEASTQEQHIEKPNIEEVRETIKELRNNEATGGVTYARKW